MTATQADTMDRETVAVLGAGGAMGFPITRNIALYLADTAADAARGGGIVITILDDEDAVIAVMNGPAGARGERRGPGPRRGRATRPGPACDRRDRAASGRKRQGARRPGLQRHLPAERTHAIGR